LSVIRSQCSIGAAIFLFIALSVAPNFSGEPDAGGSAPEGRSAAKGSAPGGRDPAGRGLGVPLSKRSLHTAALTRSYGPLIEKVELRGDDIVFTVRGKEIHYREGRMLSGENLSRAEEFDSIFYEYGTDPASPVAGNQPRSSVSDDFPDALVGSTEREVRASCRRVDFLDHRVFAHSLCADALERVDSRIRECERTSAEVRDYVARIKVVYSMKRRYVRGTRSKSYHAYGLALDVIPSSYGRKAVYWRWSAALTPDWASIPLSERWHPPQAVIDAFEENGFVWGGKWYRFDTVHFEYRPEIVVSPEILTPPEILMPRRE
jgi:hypothetical protein